MIRRHRGRAPHDASGLPAASRRLQQLIDSHGGFTLRLRTGALVPSGISIATRPSRSLTFPRTSWSDEQVTSWLAEAAGEPSWRCASIGGWLDPRSQMVWLDVVRVVPAAFRLPACLVGRMMRQHCVFDLGRCETVVLR
jgi:hypothetical protein